MTAVARTLLDLATLGDPRRAYAQAERLSLLDSTSLIALLRRSNGRRGTGRLRALLNADIEPDANAASELEHLFLDLIRTANLPLPQTNVLVDGPLVDCFWPEANLVVELDGYEFHKDRQAFERDRRKLADLRLAGREVLPLT